MFQRVRLFAGLLAFLAAGVATAQQYTLVDLGTLGGSNSGRPPFSAGNGINFSGQVTGSSISSATSHQEVAFVTTLAGVMTDLGALTPSGRSQGLAISDLGQITGNTTTSRPNQPIHAFVTDQTTNAMIDLGTLACGTDNCNATSYGTAINLFGQVTGYSTIATSTSTYHAFVTDPQTKALIDLAPDCGCSSQGLGINVYGDVAGWYATNGGRQAFFSNGTNHGLGSLGTLGGIASTGRAINNNQQVTGDSLRTDGTTHAFLWGGNMGLKDLGTLGGADSQGNALSTSGIVTGTAQTSSGEWHAFVWIGGKMTDLNAVIGAASSLYTLTSGQAINDQGQIVANGTEVATGLNVAFLLTPVPVPQTPSVTVSVTPDRAIAPGEQASVAWTSTSATSCAASGSWSAAGLLPAGSHDIQFAKAGSYGITITCTGAGGSAAASAAISVVVAPILSFSASDIPVNATTVLTWKAFAGATGCTAAGAWSGDLPLAGSRAIGPLPAGGYVYQISCTGAGVTLGARQLLTVFTPGELGFINLIPNSPNVTATAPPGTSTAGGLDGHGYTYNSQALPYPLTAFGQTFEFGRLPGTPAAYTRQTIEFPNEVLAYVTLLATGVNGNQPNQPFVLTYSDGTQSTYVQSLSDWGSPQHYPGEMTAAAMTSRITPTGATQSAKFNLYAYRIPVDRTKGLVSLKLPPTRNVIVLAVNMSLAPSVGYFTLSPYFNVNALATAGQPVSNGGLDGHGYALDADLVPPGFVWSGQQFPIGHANVPDAITKSTVALQPAPSAVSLTVLATAANGAQVDQPFLVNYADGSTTLFTQSVSDWGKPQSFPGEFIARTILDRITPTGGRQTGHWNLYAYTFQVDPKKPVVSVTLPKNRNVIVFSINSLSE